MHTRTSEAHTDVPPREHDIAKQMTKRFVAKTHDICSVLPFLSPPRSGRIGRSTRPVLETPLCDTTNLRPDCRCTLRFSKLDVLPQRIGTFHHPCLHCHTNGAYLSRSFSNVPAGDRNNGCEYH